MLRSVGYWWDSAPIWLGLAILCGALGCLVADSVRGAEEAISPEEQRERQIIERFVTVLERNPRRGTAFDRIYGHHVQWGTLDQFVERYRQRAESGEDPGTAWMVLGLVESQRGHDAAAAEAFSQAEKLRPEDAIASYYLAQSLVMVGQPDAAVESFERAIERKPAQLDLLEIFRALGRVHQRAQRPEQALEVWTRLEKLFPGDPQVLEEIALALVEEGQYEAALPRYEALVEMTDDAYRRCAYQIEAADLKVRLKRSEEGIAEFEEMLGELRPDSWLYREVRRKIEEVFLRSDDRDGLTKYYERWLENHPRDVDAMARLAHALADQARLPEAQGWLQKALTLAPSQKHLRLAFIDHLVNEQRFADAIRQYEELDKSDPGNPDYLRDWGQLILRDRSRPEEERNTAAEKVWRRLTESRPDDPVLAAQAADLFRHAEMKEQALEHYLRAVELAPGEAQYREYLGEYYHVLERPEEALETWSAIADGERHTAENVARLAEVLAGFGYLDEALVEIEEATRLDDSDFWLQMKAADLHAKAEKYDEALGYLKAGSRLAESPDEHDAVLEDRIEVYQAGETLEKECAKLTAQLDKAESPSAGQYRVLGRYYEALRQYADALVALHRALELEPESITVLTDIARVREKSGNLEEAADTSRQLAAIDPRGRTQHWTNVARLESQLGRREKALEAGRELIAAAPGNTENYRFFSGLCFRLGEDEEGLEALRRAMRANPNDPELTILLANSLSDRFRTDEAIELNWQAFERVDDLTEKLAIIERQTELYLQTNRFDRLLERLQRQRNEDELRREMTMCLAQAHHSAGDFGQARYELESLLRENTGDTKLLNELSRLAEAEGDIEAAAAYQERLAKLAPGRESEFRLATLYNRLGRESEGSAILTQLAGREQDSKKLLQSVDGLIRTMQYQAAVDVLEPRLRENPRDWELLYREGLALASLKSERARQSFQAILDLDLDDLEVGERMKAQLAAAQRSNPSVNPMDRVFQDRTLTIQAYWEIRRAVGLDSNYYSSTPLRQQSIWGPNTFGQARMAALGWLLRLAEQEDKGDAFQQKYREAASGENPSARVIWDWIYLTQMSQNKDDLASLYEVAKPLAASGDRDGQFLYLHMLSTRASAQPGVRTEGGPDTTPPLDSDEIELMLQCYDSLSAELQEGAASMPYYRSPARFFTVVSAELKRAGRDEQEQRLYEEMIASVGKTLDFRYSVQSAIAREDWQSVMKLLEAWAEAMAEEKQISYSTYIFGQLAGKLGEDEEHEKVLHVVDVCLDTQIANLKRNGEKWAMQRSRQRSASSQRPVTVAVWYGEQQSRITIDEGIVNDHFYEISIQIVRNAFEIFKRNENLGQLFDHFEARRANAPEGDEHFAEFHLCALHWWNDERAKAAEHLLAASRFLPEDTELQLQVARLKMADEDYEGALALLDGTSLLDRKDLRKREGMALDLAVRLGDVERARKAAERLFGLRLTADEQVALAGQMRQLGMNEHADALMARAQRQAGNQMSALLTLMNQYLAQGNADVAVQIAHRILRRTSGIAGMASSPYGAYSSSQRNDSTARTMALQCLAQTGNLEATVERIEKQLESSPTSSALCQRLGELYEAAGKRQEALDLHGRVVELRPEDGQLRYQYARQLEQAGKMDEACEQYAAAIKAEPRVLQRNYYEVFRTFQRAKKTTELVEALEEIDLKAIGSYWMVGNAISNLMREEEAREAGMKLFRRAWKAFPNDRLNLLAYVSNREIWAIPEMYEMAKEAFLPTPAAIRRDPWVGLHANSYSSDGTIHGPVYYLLQGIGQSDRLEQVRGEVAVAVKMQPDWLGGRALLPMLDAKRGKVGEAKSSLQELLNDERAETIATDVRRVIAQGIEEHEAMRTMAIDLYEKAFKSPNPGMNEFHLTAGPRLVKLYQAAGRRQEARDMVLQAAQEPPRNQYDPDYAIYDRIRNLSELAGQMADMDFAVDAMRLYRELLLVAESDEAKNSRYYSSMEYLITRGRDRMKQAVEKTTAEQLASTAGELLAAPIASEAKGAVDLILTVSSESEGLPRLKSLLFTLLEPKRLTDEVKTALDARLAELAKEHPDDVSVGVAAAMHALLNGKSPEEAEQAVQRLVEQVEALPLPEVASDRRPTSRQRKDAEGQIALWLVARECFQRKTALDAAELLGSRALAAARMQLDRDYVLAILNERVESALALDQKKQVEKYYCEMIDLVLALPGSASGKGTQEHRRLPVTRSQCRAALAIAQSAAETAPRMSLQAASKALATGVPIDDPKPGGLSAPQRQPTRTRSNEIDETTRFVGEIASQVKGLAGKWRRNAELYDEIFETLAGIVLPESRPDAILLFPKSVRETNTATPVSVGQLLAEAAQRAKRDEDLEKRIAARESSPNARLAATVLRAQMAINATHYTTAAKHLETLAEQLKAQPIVSNIDLGCHVAIPGLDRSDELVLAALPIVDMASESMGMRLGSGSTLDLKIARVHIKKGDGESARPYLERYLQAKMPQYARYSGDYALRMQLNDLAQVVREACHYHQVPLAMEYLGRLCDMPKSANSPPQLEVPLWHLARYLATLTPEEQYRLLHDWTVPTEDRRTVRLAAAFNPGCPVPESVIRDRLRRLGSQLNVEIPDWLQTDFGVISNFGLLVEAARQTGQLPALTDLASKAADDGVLQADLLLTLCAVAMGDRQRGEPLIDAAIADAVRRRNSSSSDEKRPEWKDAILVQACLRSPEFVDLGQTLAQRALTLAQVRTNNDYMSHLAHEMALAGLQLAAPENRAEARQTGLSLWQPGTAALFARDGLAPAWWSVHEGHVVHRTGLTNDRLFFRYPLTGEFEFTFDSSLESFGSGEVGYAGLVCEPRPWANELTVFPDAHHETLKLPKALEAYPGNTRRMKVQVRPDSVRFLVSDHLVFEETDPSPTSPWLNLECYLHRQTAFRNARFTGNPEIPREVPLTHGNRMEGWNANRLGRKMPTRLTGTEEEREKSRKEADWWSEDGVIHGRFRSDVTTTDCQSFIAYYRHLRSGDRVRYEFLYDPNKKIQVHPAMGRLAFLLDPDGVKFHWMPRPRDSHAVYDLWTRNAVEEPEHVRGPAKPPLEPGKWNRVEVALDGDVVRVQLNGVLVVERPLEVSNPRNFGLFHFRDKTSAQARNIVLTGDWPERLTAEEMANPFVCKPVTSPDVHRARHAVVGERFLTQNPQEVWQTAMELPLEQRYQRLREWVLPSALHPTFRLQMAFTPLDPAPPAVVRTPSAVWGGDSTAAAQRGGQIVCPAMELVETAQQLGRLDELAGQVDRAEIAGPCSQRSQKALQFLIALARGDDGQAETLLVELYGLAKNIAAGTPEHERYPEAVALAAAARRPALAEMAATFAEVLVKQQRDSNVSDRWQQTISHLWALARWHHDPSTASRPWLAPLAMSQWSRVDYPTAESRGGGMPASTWRFQRGEVEYFSGNSQDGLYLNVPLRGDFEIAYEQTVTDWRETHLGYHGVAITPRYDGKSLERYAVGRSTKIIKGDKQFDRWGPWVESRLVVKDGRYTAFVNGRQVHQEDLPEQPDPWVFLRTSRPPLHGRFRDVRILGSPEIPEELNLSAGKDLTGWRSNYFNVAISPKNARWQKKGDEIVGGKEGYAGSFHECVLQYHRPLLEDGTLSYEFYYEPGKTEVHPALDRLVFLLRPDGVRGHWLTDGGHEWSGMQPDGEFPLPEGGDLLGGEPLPLKAGEWNRAKVTLQGHVATVSLNDRDVARYTLEPTNQRFFGLFRHCDATDTRVRNVVYRGDWPKTLPPVTEQELAWPADHGERFDLPVFKSVSFSSSLDELATRYVRFRPDENLVQVGPDGARVKLPPTSRKWLWVGFSVPVRVSGDFDVVATVDSLALTGAKDKQATLILRADFEDPGGDCAASVDRTVKKNGERRISPTRHIHLPDGAAIHPAQSRPLPGSVTKLRLTRRGARVSYWVATKERPKFYLVNSYPISTFDVKSINLFLTPLDENAQAEVILKDLEIRGKRAAR